VAPTARIADHIRALVLATIVHAVHVPFWRASGDATGGIDRRGHDVAGHLAGVPRRCRVAPCSGAPLYEQVFEPEIFSWWCRRRFERSNSTNSTRPPGAYYRADGAKEERNPTPLPTRCNLTRPRWMGGHRLYFGAHIQGRRRLPIPEQGNLGYILEKLKPIWHRPNGAARKSSSKAPRTRGGYSRSTSKHGRRRRLSAGTDDD